MGMHVFPESVKASGVSSCVGGNQPDPPLDGFPLLVWSGDMVFTEDGATGVIDIATSFAANPNVESVARSFGTTANHVAQAIEYATKSGSICCTEPK